MRPPLMTLLGRETLDLPAEMLFGDSYRRSDIEIRVLKAFARTRKDLKPPERVGEAVRIVAELGGYLGRKND